MGPISAETTVDASREEVFDTICDLAVRPAFCDHFMHDFRLARIPASGVGAAARFRVEARGFNTWMDTEITEAERPYSISERGHCGRTNRIPAFTAWELLEGPGAVTTVRLVFGTEPSDPLDRVRERLGAGAWYGRKWSTALRRLGRVIESDEPAGRIEAGGADRAPTGI